MPDILDPIISNDLGLYSDDHRAYFADSCEHAIRLIDRIDGIGDLVDSALNVHGIGLEIIALVLTNMLFKRKGWV